MNWKGYRKMKKIIPFKKEIIFKTNLAEITSISLEHSLHKEEEYLITGAFSLNGEYKITDTSTNTEIFSYDLPFDIHMDDHYILDHIIVDIDDFYYEIVNENVLAIHIDVCVDKLEEKPLIEKENRTIDMEQILLKPDVDILVEETKEEIPKEIEVECEKKENKNEEERKEEIMMEEKQEEREIKQSENVEQVTSLFDSMNENTEKYMTYRVYIVRDGDSIETIMSKYQITREDLAAYNDILEFRIGDKLIIPALYHASSE